MTELLDRLDDAAHRERVDPSGFHALLAGLPRQARDAWTLGLEADLGGATTCPDRILLAGVGGSAIGADVAASVARDHSTTPVQVIRNYHLPPLTSSTLVILCSFSGNTEEVLTAFDLLEQSDARGIVITTGGRLGERATASDLPVLSYQWPGPPRTGIGFGVFPVLAIFRRLGVLDLPDVEVEAAIEALEHAAEEYGVDQAPNRAKALASWLHGSIPAIIGADMLEVAAQRWAGEFAENAKQVSAAYGIPEFDHNQIEAAANLSTVEDSRRYVILDAPAVHPRNRLRVAQTATMMRTAGREVQVADAGGDTPLAAILASCALGSWTSYYLALLREMDPASQDVMEELKRFLARQPQHE